MSMRSRSAGRLITDEHFFWVASFVASKADRKEVCTRHDFHAGMVPLTVRTIVVVRYSPDISSQVLVHDKRWHRTPVVR